MNLDLEKAFVYITKDPSWVNKLVAGSGIFIAMYAVFLLPIFAHIVSASIMMVLLFWAIAFVISSILCFAISGFVAETVNKRINYNNSILPDWKDFGRMILTGIKYFTGYFIYSLPIIILTVIYIILLSFWMGHSLSGGIENAFSFTVLVILGAILLSFIVAYCLFCPLMMARFYKDLKILSFVDFVGAKNMLKGHSSSYFVLILIFLAFSFLLQTILTMLVVTIAGIILIPVVYFYFYLVVAELVAQFVLETQQD